MESGSGARRPSLEYFPTVKPAADKNIRREVHIEAREARPRYARDVEYVTRREIFKSAAAFEGAHCRVAARVKFREISGISG